jgi:predicted RND superfamily exporter protein
MLYRSWARSKPFGAIPMPHALARFLIAHPRGLALLLFGAVLLAVLGAQQFRIDASSDALVVETDPALAIWRAMNTRYGSGEFLVVTYEPNTPLFETPALSTLATLVAALRAVDGVEEVQSLLDVPLLKSPPVPLDALSQGVRTLRDPSTDRALARKELLESPLFRNLLLSPDGQTTALQVTLSPDDTFDALLGERQRWLLEAESRRLTPEEDAARRAAVAALDAYKPQAAARQAALVAAVRDLVGQYRDGATVHLAGVPMIADDMLRFVRSDLERFSLGVLGLLVATLAYFFRSLRWVVLPLANAALTTGLMVGLLGAVGWPITVISSNFASLLIIISISLAIHLIVRFRELEVAEPTQSVPERLEATLRSKFWPCFFTAVTTMVAFGSLVTSGIVPVVDFGWMMTVGVALALAVTFIFFPLAVTVLPAGGRGATPRTPAFVELLGRATARHPLALLLASGLLALVAAGGISRLDVENSFLDYFAEDTEIYQGMSYVDQKLGGTTPLDVLIDFPSLAPAVDDPFAAPAADPFGDPFADPFGDPFADPQGDGGDAAPGPSTTPGFDRYWVTPARVALVEQAEAFLKAQPETGKVLSLGTLHALAKDFNDGRPLDGAELTLVLGAIPQAFQDTLLTPYVDTEASQVRLAVRMLESDRSLRRDAFLKRIQEDLPKALGIAQERVTLSGMTVLMNNMLQSLFDSQRNTLLAVCLGILLTFALLFRSLSLGLLALLPNVLAAALVLGLMGWIGLPLDLMTITIAAIVIGIGVDDTIHYIHRYREEVARDGDGQAALLRSHRSIGHAIFFTSVTVMAGFSILGLSNFNPTVYFGLLTALSMALALLANLTLLPALLLLAKGR